MGELRGNRFGTGDGRSHDDGVSTQLKGAAKLFRLADVAFGKQRDVKVAGQMADDGPVDRAVAFGFGGVAVKCSGYGIRASILGCECLSRGRDVCQYGKREVAVNAGDECGPRLGAGRAGGGAVECDDVSAGPGYGRGIVKAGRDVGSAILIALENSNDGQRGFGAEDGDDFWPVGTQAASAATES